eukprot:Filipodium_phascolosomae@DN2561_c0_g1_i11.p1
MDENLDQDLDRAIRLSLENDPQLQEAIARSLHDNQKEIAIEARAQVDPTDPSVLISKWSNELFSHKLKGDFLSDIFQLKRKTQKINENFDAKKSVRFLATETLPELLSLLFGDGNIVDMHRWVNQTIDFSGDPMCRWGLIQTQSGPCGVLAAVQAFFLVVVCSHSCIPNCNSCSTMMPLLDNHHLCMI